jgi:uncharacterized surface protein with fasciclin (FAS1) repeats
VKKTQRVASLVAAVLAAASIAACSSNQAPSSAPRSSEAAPSESAAPSSSAASGGVTTPADTFGAACSKLPQGNAAGSLTSMGPQPVATAASTNPLLTTLITAVKKAGLVDTLNSQQAITVFAPYDPAFAAVQQALGPQKFNALLADQNALGDVLKLHVIAKRYDRAGLASAGTVTSLAGGSLTIKDTGNTLSVTDPSGQTATVLCGNIPTSNATVFVIDKVLMAAKPSS